MWLTKNSPLELKGFGGCRQVPENMADFDDACKHAQDLNKKPI